VLLLKVRLTRDDAFSLSLHRKGAAPVDNKKMSMGDDKNKKGGDAKPEQKKNVPLYVDCVMIHTSLDLLLTVHVFSSQE
jgi:hypothetical protein